MKQQATGWSLTPEPPFAPMPLPGSGINCSRLAHPRSKASSRVGGVMTTWVRRH